MLSWEEFPEFSNYKKEGKRAMLPVFGSFPSLHILSKDVHENLLSPLFMKLVNATFAFGSKQTLKICCFRRTFLFLTYAGKETNTCYMAGASQ